MAISSINVARVSQNMQSSFVLDSLQRTQRNLFQVQAQLASGRRFVTPSENPLAAARALDFTQSLARQVQFANNVRYGDTILAAADSALSELNSLVIDAAVIASQTVNSLTSADERASEAQIVTAIRHQIQSVANRTFSGRYIFGGRSTLDLPFIDALGGVAYVGDIGYLSTRVESDQSAQVSTPGSVVFGALSKPIANSVDLTPKLSGSARLDTLNGATNTGVKLGVLVFNEPSGVGVFTVDLDGVDTVGDIVTLINDAAQAAGSSLTASVSDTGIDITPGSETTITDRSGGDIASSLGLLTPELTTAVISGSDLGPQITTLTLIADLAQGQGIDLTGGLIVTNGQKTVNIDFQNAVTVQDMINTINVAGVFVSARINDAGNGIDVFNQVSGSSLTIAENGGQTASDLGIRTFDRATPLSSLNLGLGVTTKEGEDDFRITARDGATVDVNVDSAVTVGDVIDLINQAAQDAGVSVEASFTTSGNGIQIIDTTGGSGALSVGLLQVSPAALQLGIQKTVTDTTANLIGDDVNPTQTAGILGALIDLERALLSDDTQAIGIAANRIETLQKDLIRQQGVIGARSASMTQKRQQLADAQIVTQQFLSDVQDLDYAQAATELQQTLTQFQANLQVGSSLLNLSLLDFLG